MYYVGTHYRYASIYSSAMSPLIHWTNVSCLFASLSFFKKPLTRFAVNTKWNHTEGPCYLPSVTTCLYQPGLSLSPSVWEGARTWGGKLTRVNCVSTQHYLGRQGATGTWLNLQSWRRYLTISRPWGLWKIAPGHFSLSTNPYFSRPQRLFFALKIILAYMNFLFLSPRDLFILWIVFI